MELQSQHTRAAHSHGDVARQNGIRSAVVSMSLGGPRSAALNDAVADLTNAGVTVVVAAGAPTHSCCVAVAGKGSC